MEQGSGKPKSLADVLSSNAKWKDYDESDEKFVQEMPKVELHVHLDGSFDPQVLWDHMQENPDSSLTCFPVETRPPWDPENPLYVRRMVQDCQSAQDFHNLCTCRGHRSLQQMLNCFSIFLPLVRRNLNLLEKLAFDFCRRQSEQHVVYTEVRYSPFLLAESFDEDKSTDRDETAKEAAVDGQAVFDAITRGLRSGCLEFGITVNQIISAIAFGPDWAMPTVDLVHRHRNDFPCATVGIDIAAGEEHFDAKTHANLHQPHFEMIQKARELNIPITLHAGEASTADSVQNVALAIHEYGARRIGHGYRVISDPELMQECRRRGIHFEVCPTSSDETGGWMYHNNETKNWKEHPCFTFRNEGLPFSLNSDDPAVFHTSLAWQYRLAMVKMGMSRSDLVKSNLQAVEACFVDETDKTRLQRLIQAFALQHGISCSGAEEDVEALKESCRSKADRFVDRVYVQQDGESDRIYF